MIVFAAGLTVILYMFSDDEGMWCHWRDNVFPGDLVTLPGGIDPPEVPPEVDSGAITLQSALPLFITMSMTTALLNLLHL